MPPLHDEDESMFWPWVMGILVLALVVWVAAQISEGPSDQQPEQPEQPVAAPATPPAAAEPVTPAAFLVWVRDSAAVREEEDAGTFARLGLRRLSSAVGELARERADSALIRRADELAAAVDTVQSGSSAYTGTLATLFVGAASLVEALNDGGSEAVARNAGQARETAAELDSTVPLDQQRHRIYQYFDFIGEAVAAIAAADAPSS